MKHVQIKNNRPRIYTANGVELQPGLNSVPADKAKEFLKHPHMAIKLERGIIEVVKGKDTKATDAEVDAAAKDTADKAKAAKAQKAADAAAKTKADAAAKKVADDKADADAKADAKTKADAAKKKVADDAAKVDAAAAKNAENDADDADAADESTEESTDDAGEGEEPAAEFEEPAYSIKGMDAKPAIEKINAIEDVAYLKHVFKTDKRVTVKEAAQNRVLDLVEG